MTATTQKRCTCGKPISGNKECCRTCAESSGANKTGDGVLSILNVGAGDVRITFDKANPGETIRARRIVTDMLRRGYALIVEVERNGERAYERVQKFDEKTGEYLIADFDPLYEQPERKSLVEALCGPLCDTCQKPRTNCDCIPDAVVEELSRPDALPRLAGVTSENKLEDPPKKTGRTQDPKDPTKCSCGAKWKHQGQCKGSKRPQRVFRRMAMEGTKATAVGRSAGG